jgi:2',3'-cyclic-nucleotide 2'-phosphodiesterase (5'-nucleotidase family)
MLGPLLAAAALLAAPADSILLRVLTTSDFHGALEPRVTPWSAGRPVGGLAALKGLMDSLEAECGCPVLRLDAGDQMQGTLMSNLVHGRSAVAALNLLGLDAAVIGNHELDWGVDTLRARIAEARYPWLAANLLDSATARRPDWVRPSAVLEAGPFRVGVVGYANARTRQMLMARHGAGLAFAEGPGAIAGELDRLRGLGVDFTVVVAHEGAYCEPVCRGEIVDLAGGLDSTRVPLLVAGHTHSVVSTRVNGIAIVAARANATALGVADLVRRADGTTGWTVRVENVYADRVRADSAALALVEGFRALTAERSHAVVVTLADSLSREGAEFPLGNLIADAQRAAAGADVGLMNNGGIRRDLLPGPVTYGDLFELHPFGNMVVAVDVTPDQLRLVLEHTLRRGRPGMHVSGIRVRYDPAAPAGHRIQAILDAAGRPLDPRRTYVLALSDFLAGGGDGLPVLPALPRRDTGMADLDALVAHLRRLPQPVRGPRDTRFLAVEP